MRSLRNRLFLMIVLPLILVAAIAVFVRHQIAAGHAERLYDNTLHAVAKAISRDVVLSEGDVLAEELLDELTETLGDPIYYRVVGPDGGFVAGYTRQPEPDRPIDPPTSAPQFFDGRYYDDPVRALVFREFISEPQFGGWVTVQVWQTVRQRHAHSLRLTGLSAMFMALIILAAGAAVWFGINLGLRPLLELKEAVAQRSPDDLGPIKRPVPPEVSSLVAAMNALFERLSMAFAARDALISNAAHQLRNPIAGIQAQAEAAESAPDEQELRVRVASVAEAARRTSRLTQQLLSLEKAKGRGTGGQNDEIDLKRLAADVLRRHAPDALRGDVSITFESEGEPTTVQGDAVMLTEALDNLIDNALRYGCADGGQLSVCVSFGQDHVRLDVQDQGPGVPEAERDRIFERFHRAMDDGVEGCGLGLSIVREVAERHGGDVRLADTTKGARFELRLPIRVV
ncbi:MAG: sensor histidine kinase N-terminal domain-containing protein [Geminicoccaceae bacterium]